LTDDSPEGAHLKEVAAYLFSCFLRWLRHDVTTYGQGAKQLHIQQLKRIVHEISLKANLQPCITFETLLGNFFAAGRNVCVYIYPMLL
jgi:hypothetical protein